MADIATNENASPSAVPSRTPGSGNKRKVIINAKNGDFNSSKSTRSAASTSHARDDSLSRAVQNNSPAGVESWLKPSSVKRLQQPTEAEKIFSLEQENNRLREAMKKLKQVMENQTQLVVNSAAIVEGAKKYVVEKSATQRLSQKRTHESVSIQIRSWEKFQTHAEYRIEVRLGNDNGHTISKRFSEFLGLHQRLLTTAEIDARYESCFFWHTAVDELKLLTLKSLRKVVLPSKVWFGNFKDSTLDNRSEGLQTFLEEVIKVAKRAGKGSELRSILSDWLGIQQCDEESAWADDRIKPLREFDTRAKQARVSEAFETLLNQSPIKKVTRESVSMAYSPSPLRMANVDVTANVENDLSDLL